MNNQLEKILSNPPTNKIELGNQSYYDKITADYLNY
jgi:hypothetical protein